MKPRRTCTVALLAGLFLISLTAPAPADILATPHEYDFGDVAVGTSVPLTITIDNVPGEVVAPLMIYEVYFAAESSPDFDIITTPGSFTVLQVGESADIEITYSPSTAGITYGFLEIFNNDPFNTLFRVPLRGRGAVPWPLVQVSPLEYDFGDVEIGESSTVMVSITNAGPEPIYLDDILFQPGASSNFSITLEPAQDQIDPGLSELVEITYAPSGPGVAAAVLDVSWDNGFGDFVDIAAGRLHSLGLKSDGAIVATGAGQPGQSCDVCYGQCDVPSPNTDFVAVAAGKSHSLGLKANGSILAWGAGQPDGYAGDHCGQCIVPSPNTDFTAIAAGRLHSLGLKEDGAIVAWGSNWAGQCEVPLPNNGFVAIAGGGDHSLGLEVGGSIVAWGNNNNGQCDVPAPNTGFVAIAAGLAHSLGLKDDGSIVAWGYNWAGQCDTPSSNAGFAAVAAGGFHSLGLKVDGSIVAWGWNDAGQCDVPLPNTGFVAIAGGGSFGDWQHSLGLKDDGSIVAWGYNGYGQCFIPALETGVEEVAISGTGVTQETPPEEVIEAILDFLDASVADGTLWGDGPGNSGDNRLNALINMLEAASDLIEAGDYEQGCQQLWDVYFKVDGESPPPDFVDGPAAAELAIMVLDVIDVLGCG